MRLTFLVFLHLLVGDAERIRQGARRVSAPILFRFPLHRRASRIHLGPVGQAAGTAPAQLKQTRIMQQMRMSGPIQLRALAEELDARQEAKCQKREIDLVHDPPARPDETQKSDRSGETSL